jgi:cell division protein ZipA
MDKDLIRIIIFAIGLLVILGMIAWSYLKNEKRKRSYQGFDEDSEFSGEGHSRLGCDESDYADGAAENTFDETASDIGDDNDELSAEQSEAESAEVDADAKAIFKKPAIIQFSIVATTEDGFSGVDIYNVLDDVGLEYGNLQIFERLDARRLVDYGVANMVKPGIFPSTNLAAFHSPGIVFFMQPAKLENAVAVFDDFVRTFQYVATQLGGRCWITAASR